MSENTTKIEISPAQQKPEPIPAKQVKTCVEKEFELAVYDINEDEATGKKQYIPVNYSQPVTIKVRSPKELKEKLDMFSQCNQFAKVLRELTSKTIEVDTGRPIQQNLQQQEPHPEQSQTMSVVQDPPCTNPYPVEQAKTKPRYFKLGDVEVKEDNGVFYQKQWMRLTESEAANFRIINDKSNASINLNGKHIEMKKWVRVEANQDKDDTTSLQEGLE